MERQAEYEKTGYTEVGRWKAEYEKMHNNASNYINSESYIGNIALFLKDALEYMRESSNTIDKSLQ